MEICLKERRLKGLGLEQNTKFAWLNDNTMFRVKEEGIKRVLCMDLAYQILFYVSLFEKKSEF